jgi:TatD DNase family protein
MRAVFACNAYIDEQAPWALRKTDPERMQTVLATLYIASRSWPWRSFRSCPARRPSCSTRWAFRRPAQLCDAHRRSHWYSPLARAASASPSPRACSRGSNCRGRGRGGLMLIDSHCHLNTRAWSKTGRVLARPAKAGVGGFLNISTRQSEWAAVVATAEREPDVWASVGIHPHEADQHADLGEAAARSGSPSRASSPSAKPGSTTTTTIPTARCSRRCSARISCRARNRPAGDHPHPRCRGRYRRDPVDEMGKGAFPALIHCFTASAEFGRKVLDLGLTISLSGIVTFKNAKDLQEFAKEIPEDRLLVETDSPFLAPVPHRGKTCEPAFVRDTARSWPACAGDRLEALAETTTRNFFRLFSKAAVKLIVLGSGTSDRRAADRQRLGRVRSAEPKNRRTRVSIMVESNAGQPAAGRHIDRPAPAVARLRDRQGRRGVLDPRPCRSLPRHR